MASEIEVGRAAVRIFADDSDFWRDIRRLSTARVDDIKVKADADTAEASAKIQGLKRESASADDTIDIDVDRGGIAGLNVARQSVAELGNTLRGFGEIVQVARIPFLLAGIGALPAIASAATVAVGRLALGLGQGLAGAAAVGGTAIAGAAAGLTAYVRVVSAVVSQTREAYLLLHENVKEQLAHRRAVILDTEASHKFNLEVNRSSIFLAKVSAEIGQRVLPSMARWMAVGRRLYPEFRPSLMRLVEGVTQVADSFVTALRQGERLASIRRIFGFIASSGVRAAQVAKQLGLFLIAAIRPVLGPAASLQRRLVGLARAMRQWGESARGQRQITQFIQDAWRRAQQLYRIVVNLGRGFRNLFQIISPGTSDMFRSIERLSESFAHLGAKGTESRRRIQEFVRASGPILRALGRLVGTLVTEFFKLAGNVAKMREGGRHANVLARAINGLARALPPVRKLLQQTFKDLGPTIGPLARQVARFFRTFAGSTDVLVRTVRLMTRLLEAFNKLPAPVKTVVANLVAFRIVSRLLGFSILVKLAASAGKAAASLFRVGRGATAAGTASKTMGVRIGAIVWPIALLTAYGDLLFNGGRGHKYLTEQIQRSSPALRAFNNRLKENRIAQGRSNDSLATFVNRIGQLATGKWIGSVAEGVKKMGDAHAGAAKKTEDGTARVVSAWGGAQKVLVGNSIIPDMVNKMNQHMGPGVKQGTDAGARNVGAFKNAVTSHLSQTNQQASSWRSAFTNIFSGISLYNTGREIITGLLNGLQSAWSSVQEWLQNAANSVPDTVKKVLQHGSPSKVMHRIGRDTVQGFVNGIRERQRDVDHNAHNLGFNPMKIVKKLLRIASPSAVFRGYGNEIGRGMVRGMQEMIGQIQAMAANVARAATPPGYTIAEDGSLVPNGFYRGGGGGRTIRSPGRESPRTAQMFDYGDISQAKWDRLLARGWQGRAGDNVERIYRPTINIHSTDRMTIHREIDRALDSHARRAKYDTGRQGGRI